MAPPPFSPSPRPKGAWGGGRKILAPMGNELRKSYKYKLTMLVPVPLQLEDRVLHSSPLAEGTEDEFQRQVMRL